MAKEKGHQDKQRQRGNQNPYIEEEQTTQWPKEKKYKREKKIYIG
jgi:hypothetical protein